MVEACGGLPQHVGRIGGQIWDRTGLSGVPAEASLAGRFRLSALPRDVGLDDQAQPAGLRWLPVPSVADGGYDLPGYAETADPMVPGHWVGDRAKKWSQCLGAAADSGLGQLPHRLDVVAQTAARHGVTGP